VIRVAVLAAYMAFMGGCALFTEYIPVNVPVKEPCLDALPTLQRVPLADLAAATKAKALESGNEYLLLDVAMASLIIYKTNQEALINAIQPCVRALTKSAKPSHPP